MVALPGNRGDWMVVVRLRIATTKRVARIVPDDPFAVTYFNPADDPSKMK
jgi:hypothetical protein